MALPKIDAANLKKPLCYDPDRKKFIFFDEIVSGEEKIIPVDELSDDDLKQLIVERQRAGPDYTVQAISGPPMSRDDVVQAIEKDQPFGSMTLEAEKTYLRHFLSEIEQGLNEVADNDIEQSLSEAADNGAESKQKRSTDNDAQVTWR
jgi:hypothetical protein